MENTNVYRVNRYLDTETITITYVGDKYVSGPSDYQSECVVVKAQIESMKNPLPNEHDVRYFDSKQSAQNYIHNALVHQIQTIHDASDKEIIDMLLMTDKGRLPGEVNHALTNRVNQIMEKLK